MLPYNRFFYALIIYEMLFGINKNGKMVRNFYKKSDFSVYKLLGGAVKIILSQGKLEEEDSEEK